MAYNNDFFRVRTVKDSLNVVLGSIKDLTLDDGKTLDYLKGVLNRYIDKLEDLVLYKTEGLSVTEQLEVDRAQSSLEVFNYLAEILTFLASENSCMKQSSRDALLALKQEGLFSPNSMYQLKEDFEALSLPHTKHKKETKYLIEQSAIATQRNAQLRVENDELKDELACLRAKLK